MFAQRQPKPTPFTAAGNKRGILERSPLTTVPQTLQSTKSRCCFNIIMFLVFFCYCCCCFCVFFFSLSPLGQVCRCPWCVFFPADDGLIRLGAHFFKTGSTRTPRICRDAPEAERSGGCAVAGLQRDAPRHSDEQSAAPATRAVSATAER